MTALVLVASTAVGLVGPLAIGRIVDHVTRGDGPGSITWPVVVLAAVAIGQSVLTALGSVLVSRCR